MGEYSTSKQQNIFGGDFGQEGVYRVLEAVMWRQGMIGWGCITDLIQKDQGMSPKYRDGRQLGIWGLANWVYCVSD